MKISKEDFLEILYNHQALIHKVCRIYRDSKEDREDLFQEIIYQLWKSSAKFEGKSKWSTWIYRISMNTAIATFRKPKIRTTELDEFSGEISSVANTEMDPREAYLFEAIRKLKIAERTIISLYLEGMNYREMAEILGMSENNIGVSLSRIRNKLKKSLNKLSWT